MEKLQTAGMLPLGKTNMDEFAMGSTTETSAYGPTRNPWNTAHVPGGSSGGSAAAVAAREALVALGSDTGGSIRQPASYCGVTGFKPTYGTVSRYGLIAYASSLDQIGPIARDVADCAAMMDILSGKDEKDGTSLPDSMQPKAYLAGLDGNIRGTRIAVPDCIEEGVEEDVRQATLDMAGILESAGAKISQRQHGFSAVRDPDLLYHRGSGSKFQPVPFRRREVRISGRGLCGLDGNVLQEQSRGIWQ